MPTLNDPIAISLGPIDLRWYALFILVGIGSAIGLSYWLAAKRGLDPGFLLDLAPWVVFLGIAGARVYFVLLEWDYFQDRLTEAINIRSGGLSIHGAIVAGVIVIVVFCRIAGQSSLTWMDVIVPGVALGQAIGRWGNWANQEAFGKPTDLPWAVTIDPERRPDGYTQFATFHPTFLYESIFNLANAIVLSWLVLRAPVTARLRAGDVTALYLIAYGVARFIIERMRTDSLHLGALPAAYWLSLALITGGVLLMALNRTVFRRDDPQPDRVGS
jgi:phosphatidylglycerol:prolipoprotein diacylglycerol transferase